MIIMKKKNLFMTLGLALTLGAGVAAGLSVNKTAVEAKAYGPDDTTWYAAGGFNGWNLHDSNYHLSYIGTTGEYNNWQFRSDHAFTIEKGQTFKIVYSWYDEGTSSYKANYFGDESQGKYLNIQGSGELTGGGYADVTAPETVNVMLYFQMNQAQNWFGLYWSVLSDDEMAIVNWSIDFLDDTKDICATTSDSADHHEALDAIWTDKKTSFEALTGDQKDLFVTNSGNDLIASAAQRYVHIMKRYNNVSGTTSKTLAPFEGGPSYASKISVLPTFEQSNDYSAVIIVASVSTVALIAGVGYLMIKRRKEN